MNLVNFGPVTQEITRVECAISAATRPQFAVTPSFGTLVFHDVVHSDLTRLIGRVIYLGYIDMIW